MTQYSRRTLFRLKLSTAMVGTLITGRLGAELPGNYSIPVGNVAGTNPVVTATDNAGGPLLTINPTDIPPANYENMAIQLRRGNTVLNWGTFNLTASTDAQASTLSFTSTVGAASVLNRVAAGNPSTILGTITAMPDVAVWLVNTSGITVGAGGSFNGAALVLSASDITAADFDSAAPSKTLTGVDTAAPISLTGAGALTASGSIVVVGQAITANKIMTSTNGDVALIAARDITLPISLGSPLAITITKGTNLGTAVNVGAALTGQSVRIFGAGEGGAIASLLNINAGGLLTARAANGVVVLATQTSALGGVTISSAAAVDGITVGGALTAGGAGGDVVLSSTGALTSTGTIIADDAVNARAATSSLTGATATTGSLTLNVTTGDLTFPGVATFNWATNLTLGAGQDVIIAAPVTSPANVTINAGRHVRAAAITSTTGNIDITAATGDISGIGLIPLPLSLVDYGRTILTASTSSATSKATALSGTAQLGTVVAGAGLGTVATDQIEINARIIDLTSATATNGNLKLTSTLGEVRLETGSAGADATVLAATNARIGTLTSRAGNVSVTAAAGDVTGVALIPVPLVINDYGRSNLTASSADKFVVVSAIGGVAQLGVLDAGAGPTTLPGYQIEVEAEEIDLTSATTANGSLKLTSTVGDVRIGTGDARVDAVVLAQTNARIGSLRARTGNINVTATTGDVSGLARGTVATDGRLLPGYDRANLRADSQDKTIRVTAAAGTAQLGTVDAGAGATRPAIDQVRVDATAIDVASATATNGNLYLASTSGDVRLGSGNAGFGVILRAETNLRVDTVVAQTGNINVSAILGDISGRVLGVPVVGQTLPGYGRAALTSSAGDTTVTATALGAASGIAQLGILSAGAGATNIVADQVRVDARMIDLTSASALNGRVYLASTFGDLLIGDQVSGYGNITLISAEDVLIKEFNPLVPTTGFVRSISGDVTLTAAKSVYGIADSPLMVIDRGYGTIKTTGNLNINATGDLRVNGLDAGGYLDVRVIGSLTGQRDGNIGTNVTGGALFANGTGRSVSVTAGTGTTDTAKLNTIEANVDVNVTAYGIATGTIKAVTGNANIAPTPADNFYIGLLDLSGNRTFNFVDAPSAIDPSSISSTALLEPGYGKTKLDAGQYVLAGVGRNAQLGDVRAGTYVDVEARGLTASSATANNGLLTLTASDGTLELGTGRASTTAFLRKNGGSVLTAGDELRVMSNLTATTGATVFSNTHARLNEANSTADALVIDASFGDVTGVAGLSVGTSNTNYGRGLLQAGTDVTVTSAGLVQLSSVTAGVNLGVNAGNGTPTNGAIDIISATATNGALFLSARTVTPVVGTIYDGDVRLGSGNAGTTATLSNVDRGGAAGDIFIAGPLAAKGNILVDGARDVSSDTLTASGPGATLVTVRAVRNAAVGALNATEDVFVQAGGSAAVASAIAGDDVDVVAGTTATVSGTVTAGLLAATGDYRVTGGTGVVLGDNTPRNQSATGVVDIKATTGDVSQGAGLLTLTSNSDFTLPNAAEILTITATTGSIFLGNSDLIGGSVGNRESEIILNAGQAVAIGKADGDRVIIDASGDVTANRNVTGGYLGRGADSGLLDPGKQTVYILSGRNVSLKSVAALGTAHDIDIRAAGTMAADVLTAAGTVAVRAGDTITISTGLVKAGEDVAIKSNGGAVLLANVEAGDDIDLQAAGEITLTGANAFGTGPDTRSVTFPGAALAAAYAAEPPATIGSNIHINAGGIVTATAALNAPRDITVIGQTLDLATASAVGNLTLRSTSGDVKIDTGTAGIATSINAAANARIGAVIATAGGVLVTAGTGDVTGLTELAGFGRANLTSFSATAGVQVSALLGTVKLGIANAGAGTAALALDQVKVDARAIDINTATAVNGNLALRATAGNLRLGTGSARGLATLATAGGAGDVIVDTALNSGGAATVTSVRDAQLAAVTATTGDLTVTALSGQVTGFGAGAANLTATAGTVTVDAGTLARLGTTKASGDIAVTGDAISVDDATAGQAMTLVADAGGAKLVKGSAGTTALVQASALADVGTMTAQTDATVRGASLTATTLTATTGNLLAQATGGNATVGTGTAKGTGTITATGAASATTSLTADGAATLTAGGAATGGLVRSIVAGVTVTGASIAVGTADAKTALVMAASNGNLSVGTGTAGTTGDLRTTGGAGDVTISTSLTTGGAATVTSVSDARLASTKATTGDLIVKATSGEVTGVGAGSANLEATAGKVTVEAGTLARLGIVKANANVNLAAQDIDIQNTVTATKVTVTNNGSAQNTLRLGDSVGTGFTLDQGEFNLLKTPTIEIDAGTLATPQDIAIGKLGFGLGTNPVTTKVTIFGIRRIDVSGAVTASNIVTDVRLGGTADPAPAPPFVPSNMASIIRVAAKADGGGGSIRMGSATLELRGIKIGFGQDGGFLTPLGLGLPTPQLVPTPLDRASVATSYIGNAQSTLYNAAAAGGGERYNDPKQVLLEARTLVVRVGDYALIQNTGSIGTSEGTILGGTTAAPVLGALVVFGGRPAPNPSDAGGFALFGTINGLTNSSAALLGTNIINITAVDRANTRVNGCLVGSSGGGCLVNVVSQPILNVFDSSKADIFKSAADFEVPFDPVVGTNNEALFGDVGTFGLADIPIVAPDCTDPKNCPAPQEQK